MKAMEIYINGEPRPLEPETTVAALLERLGYTGRRVAVEINHDIVPRSGYHAHPLRAGDRVEIVQAIGGG